MCGQCQLAAGDKVELSRLAPDLQHDCAHRIAGERIRSRSQCMVHVSGVDADEKTRIETEFGKSAHRDRTRFNFREILPDPNHRTPRGHAPRNPCDKASRHSALPPRARKHLVHSTQSETALQARVCIGMAEPHPAPRIRLTTGLEALDTVAQNRNRACATHAHRSSKDLDRFPIQREPDAGSFVHDMF